jgi:iron uptake system component EfeO
VGSAWAPRADCNSSFIELTTSFNTPRDNRRLVSPTGARNPKVEQPEADVEPIRILGAASFIALVAAASAAAQAGPLDDAVERYRPAMIENIDRALAGAHAMRDRIAADDIAGAQKAWIDARVGWERSEVFTAGFVPELDQAIDAWPDAVAGFHGIEVKLFGADPANMGDETAALIRHLTELDAQVRAMALTPQGLLNGVVRLAYEVGDSKVDGGESRYSGTSLDDMRNNVDGIELAYRTLFDASVEAADPKLAERVAGEIDKLRGLLAVADLKKVDADRLRDTSEALIVSLQAAGPKIGLATPTLEETAK